MPPLLIDQDFPDTTRVSSNLDEYLWLDGRPVVAFRGKVSGMGVHEAEGLASPPTTSCSRAAEGGAVHCGAYHLVSNQQNFVVLALSDYDGKVASFALPDADGQINRPRFVHFGGYLSGHDQKFDVPTSFSKEARFRTVYTGGWVTDYGTWPGISEMRLTAPDGGFTGISPGTGELRRVTSPWSTAMTGTQNVTWSTVCSSNCASATDMLEWRVWETGGPKFNTRLRFPGQYHDAETDFYENWNRFYDPTTGRYLSVDPLSGSPEVLLETQLAGRTWSAMGYADANPTANVDPTGLVSFNTRSASKNGGPGWATKWAGILHEARKMASNPACRDLFMRYYGADLDGLLKDGFGPSVHVADATWTNLTNAKVRTRAYFNPLTGNIVINTRDFKYRSEKATAVDLIHELAHYSNAKAFWPLDESENSKQHGGARQCERTCQ